MLVPAWTLQRVARSSPPAASQAAREQTNDGTRLFLTVTWF